MKKAALLLSLLLCMMMLFSTSVSAHTGLRSASPDASEKVEKPVTEVHLTFGTKIESISTLKVTNEQGTEVKLNVTTGKDSMTGTFEQPLENGRYAVEWRIIGEDGHAIKDTYSFTVALPESESNVTPSTERQSPAAAEGTADTDQPNEPAADADYSDKNAEAPATDQDQQEVSSSAASSSMSSSTILALVVLACCLVIAGFGIRAIRNKK